METESMASDLSGIKDEDLLRKMVSDFNCWPLSCLHLMRGSRAMIREATVVGLHTHMTVNFGIKTKIKN